MCIRTANKATEQVMKNKSLLKNTSGKASIVVYGIVICCMIIALFFCLGLFSSNIRKELEESAKISLLEATIQKRDKIDITFNGSISSLESIASLRSSLDNISDKEFIGIVFDKETHQKYSRVAIADYGGDVIFNDGSTIQVNESQAIGKSLNNECAIEFSPSIKTGENVVVCSAPIVKDNVIDRVLIAEMSPYNLQKSFDVLWGNKTSYAYIVTNKGEVIVKPNNPYSDSDIVNIFDVVNSGEANADKIKQDFINGKSNVEIIMLDNQKKYIAYTPLKAVDGWYTVSVVAQEPIMKRANEVITNTLFLSLFVLIVISAIMFYIFLVKRFSKKEIEMIANHDPVTGCSSWYKFNNDYANSFKKAKVKKHVCIYMNIKNFKFVNDILGYDVGNLLLQHIAGVLQSQIGKNEIFSRSNSDKFCMILEYENDNDLLDRLNTIETEIRKFKHQKQIKLAIYVCFGIYKIPDEDLPLSVISDRAMLAMQNIKKSNETNLGFFNKTAIQRIIQEKELENDMQTAMDKKEFAVFLQPKIDLITQRIVGAEALVRWYHPEKGILSPDQFIDLFESNGFIVKLDFYMFEEACKLLREWIDSDKKPIPISVNISRVHLYNPNVAEELYGLALKYHIDPKLIEIELTESMNFENINMLFGIVKRLKRFNFTVSIDDFGTGYSSLHILKELPVDIIKIDKDFLDIDADCDGDRSKKIITSIIEMAKRLDMKTVAEGVEKKDQVEFLTSVSCDYVQGFYFSKPITISEFQNKYINKL